MNKQEARALAEQKGPKPGQVFRHYKGGYYTVVGMAIKEDTLEPLVIYFSNTYGGLIARTLDAWNSMPNDYALRFERVEP